MKNYKTPIYRLTDQYKFNNNTSKHDKASNTNANIKSFFTANSKSIDRNNDKKMLKINESLQIKEEKEEKENVNMNNIKNRVSSMNKLSKNENVLNKVMIR